jgi:AraC family transcriptional regulator of adaptative response/methylated-DNA-[protein]-cysteine methyltransferase
MKPTTADWIVAARAIAFLDRDHATPPSLADVAAHVRLSDTQLQKLFTRWAGISPKRFLQHRTTAAAKAMLRSGRDVLTAAYDAGVSGPGRLHDLLVTAEAVTPGEYKTFGAGLTIRWGVHGTPFGDATVAVTARGLCHVSFAGDDAPHGVERLAQDWPAARLVRDDRATAPVARAVFAPLGGRARGPLALHLKGTNFQLRVWDALLRVPPGTAVSYAEVAAAIGAPRAVRAVGSAVGANPLAYLIPCHRVLRATGALGGYRWGVERKGAILAVEALRGERVGQ